MSAVRMVAYGVLELPEIPKFDWEDSDKGRERSDALRKHDEVMFLVKQELAKLDLVIVRSVKSRSFLGKEFLLMGQRQTVGFVSREEIARGSFRDCCVVAADILDRLEPST